MSGRWDDIEIDPTVENRKTLFWSLILMIAILLAFALELMESGS